MARARPLLYEPGMCSKFFTQLAIQQLFPVVEVAAPEVLWDAPWVHECDTVKLKRRFLIVRAASPTVSG